MRDEEAVENIKKYRKNLKYLRSVELNIDKINVSTDLVGCIKDSDIIIIVTPSAFLTSLFADFPFEHFKGKTVFSSVKGIIPEYNAIPARFIHKTFGTPYEKIGIICGPCHAEEVALERLSYLTIACQDEDIACHMAELFSTRYIKTTTSGVSIWTALLLALKCHYANDSAICSCLSCVYHVQDVIIGSGIE